VLNAHGNLGQAIRLLLALFAASAGWCAELPPTFAEWNAACARLPFNRSLGTQPPPSRSLPLKGFAALDLALDGFFSIATNGPMATPAHWVGKAPARDTFFNVAKGWFLPPAIPFEPFTRKLDLPPGSKVVLLGDLHGDIHSLLAILRRLQEEAWLSGFTLTSTNVHLVFLGDYTDRGQYGSEVLYTLLRLVQANPDRVHLVRGNHEDVSLVARYGFLAEAQAKFGPGLNAPKLLRAYDFLPVSLYLGWGGEYVQLCHGGMEPGYSPALLLNAPGTNRYQLLGPLPQATFLNAHPDWLADEPDARSVARQYLRDFTPVAPTSPAVLGFMWNDFTVFRDEPGFAFNPDRAFVYGRTAVQYLLEQAGSGGAKLRAVIRGHQHAGMPDPLMRRLVASQGLFRHWQETNSLAARNAGRAPLARQLESGLTRRLPEHSVWTFNVAPDSVYGAGCDFDFATFGVLHLAPEFKDWQIDVVTVVVNIP
jgi:hypothetical protein